MPNPLADMYGKGNALTQVGLSGFPFQRGLAPFGLRHSGEGAKGRGYFGMMKRPDGGVSTELSAQADGLGEFPLMVPTLDPEEIQHLLGGGKPTESIYQKAMAFAAMRKKHGVSAFSQPGELRASPDAWK